MWESARVVDYIWRYQAPLTPATGNLRLRQAKTALLRFVVSVKCQYETFMAGAACREFESEAPVAAETLDRVACSREQFSFQMCLESGDGSGTFRDWRQRVPDSWCRDTECLGLILVAG